MRSSEAVSLAIHPMEAGDRSRVHEILKSVGVFNSDEIACAVELFDIYLKKGVDPNEYVFCGAYQDGVLKAFECFGKAALADRVYDLYWIATDPACRQTGLAMALMEDLDRYMLSLRARKILAETSSKVIYEKAHRLYLKCGFQKAALIRDYYAVGDDLLIFEKTY